MSETRQALRDPGWSDPDDDFNAPLLAPACDWSRHYRLMLMVTEHLGGEQVLATRIGRADIRVAGIDPEPSLATGPPNEVAA